MKSTEKSRAPDSQSFKAALDKKEKSLDFKSKLIAERRAQKAKSREQKQINKSLEVPVEIAKESQPAPEQKVHFKKSMLKKTRSK